MNEVAYSHACACHMSYYGQLYDLYHYGATQASTCMQQVLTYYLILHITNIYKYDCLLDQPHSVQFKCSNEGRMIPSALDVCRALTE